MYVLMWECGICGRLSSGPSCKYHGSVPASHSMESRPASQVYPIRVVKGGK